MNRRTPGLNGRIATALVAFAVLAAACSSGDQSSAATTTAPEAVATTTTTTTEPRAPTTTIATPEPIPIEPPEGYELTWNDEFDGEEIDTSNWTYDIGGWGWGNGEAQYYTDRPKNARIQNGLLVVEADFEEYEENYYTSARLLTQGLQEFKYGYIEARIKVPEGVGTWPAFWMLGANFGRETADPDDSNWPDVGEIDIMEYAGRDPDLILGTIHGPGYAGAGGLTTWNRQEFPIADDFHTFAVDWDFDGIRWYFNDELYADKGRDSVGDREWVFDQPFFIILNLALGGTVGGPIGFDTEFPQFMYVDYVRVYQKVEDAGS